jgi:hypothetical protein
MARSGRPSARNFHGWAEMSAQRAAEDKLEEVPLHQQQIRPQQHHTNEIQTLTQNCSPKSPPPLPQQQEGERKIASAIRSRSPTGLFMEMPVVYPISASGFIH